MYIQQRMLSWLIMNWRQPFLETWEIPCWGNVKSVRKCECLQDSLESIIL